MDYQEYLAKTPMNKVNPLVAALKNCTVDEIACALACVNTDLTVPALCKFFKKYFAVEDSAFPQRTTELFMSLHGKREA